MSETTQYLSDYLKELDSYMKRLDRDGLSRKDQKLFLELSNEYYDIFQKEKDFPKEILQEIAEFGDNIMNQSDESKNLAKGYRDNIVRQASDYIDISTRTELQFGVFQKDVEIYKLQDEKLQMLQELSDLDMKLYGQITKQTQGILNVQGYEIVNGRVWDIHPWEQVDSVSGIDVYQKDQDKTLEKEKASMNQQRVKLRFPYMTRDTFMKVKDEIKHMGAKFDPKNKEWYVEESTGQDVIDNIRNYLDQHDEAVYLKLPFTEEAQKFRQILDEIKQNGARYNPIKKRWYITEAMDRSKFSAYLPTSELLFKESLKKGNNSVHEKLSGYKAEAERRADHHEMGARRQEMPERT